VSSTCKGAYDKSGAIMRSADLVQQTGVIAMFTTFGSAGAMSSSPFEIGAETEDQLRTRHRLVHNIDLRLRAHSVCAMAFASLACLTAAVDVQVGFTCPTTAVKWWASAPPGATYLPQR
jgi:hypothetical protein